MGSGSGSAVLGRKGAAVLLWYFLYTRLWKITGLMVKLRVSGDLISSPNYIRNYLCFLKQIPWLRSATVSKTFRHLQSTEMHRWEILLSSRGVIPSPRYMHAKLLTEADGQSLWCFITLWIASLLVQQQYLWTLFYEPRDGFCWYWLMVSQVYLSL